MALLARASLLLRASCRGGLLQAAPAAVGGARAMSSYPTDRRYKASHEWAKLEAGGVATVGITEHAQAALGDIVFADLPEVGAAAAAGEPAATVESVKAAADIYAPLDGEVVAVNPKLDDSPDLINQHPHDDGWMFQLKLADPAALDGLMDAAEYEKSIAEDSD